MHLWSNCHFSNNFGNINRNNLIVNSTRMLANAFHVMKFPQVKNFQNTVFPGKILKNIFATLTKQRRTDIF